MNVIPGEKTIEVILTVCTATHYVVLFFLDAMFTKSNASQAQPYGSPLVAQRDPPMADCGLNLGRIGRGQGCAPDNAIHPSDDGARAVPAT